jgi:hypothetical protein
MNELRAGWLRVSGGQLSENRGVDFAGETGLEGVTRDPRDIGFPQISTAGLYSTMGDPTSFVYRRNEHFELYENLLLDRGAHHLKFGTYLFHLRFRPEQPDNARGAFNYTGQFSGNAFADFLLGYPTSAVSGIGRGSEDGRTNWIHLFAQDDWRVRRNLTVNLGSATSTTSTCMTSRTGCRPSICRVAGSSLPATTKETSAMKPRHCCPPCRSPM